MADVLVGAPSIPKIQIVPVRGLPIVAVVIAGLVVTIATLRWPGSPSQGGASCSPLPASTDSGGCWKS